MNCKLKTRSVSLPLYVISFALAFLAGSCSVDSPLASAGQNEKDTLAENPENIKHGSDSTVIFILSPDGILLRKFSYPDASSSADNADRPRSYVNYIKGYPTDDTIMGDFNGDGKVEKAWFKYRGEKLCQDCQDKPSKKSCKGIIRFSEKSIRALVIDYCPMGIFRNEGDINCDGKDEIGVLPGWYTSSCRDYYLFTYKNNRWIISCTPVASSTNMRAAGICPVEKDTARKGYAIIRESMLNYIDNNPNHKIPPEYSNYSCCSASNVVESHVKLR